MVSGNLFLSCHQKIFQSAALMGSVHKEILMRVIITDCPFWKGNILSSGNCRTINTLTQPTIDLIFHQLKDYFYPESHFHKLCLFLVDPDIVRKRGGLFFKASKQDPRVTMVMCQQNNGHVLVWQLSSFSTAKPPTSSSVDQLMLDMLFYSMGEQMQHIR